MVQPLLVSSSALVRVTDARASVDELLRVLPLGGKGVALLLSVSVHAALALTFVHGAAHGIPRVLQKRDAVVEIAVLDVAVPEVPAQLPHPQSAALAPHHSHPYPVSPDHDLTPHDPSLEHEHPAVSGSTADAAVLESPLRATPRFVLSVGPAAHAGASAAGDIRAETPGAGGTDEPAAEASVDTPATLLAGNSASYTPEAEAAGVEANVALEIVVNAAGAVVNARVLTHVGYGLDEAALRGVRAYRFVPARRAGTALAVRMRWVMRFQLR